MRVAYPIIDDFHHDLIVNLFREGNNLRVYNVWGFLRYSVEQTRRPSKGGLRPLKHVLSEATILPLHVQALVRVSGRVTFSLFL